MRKCNKRMIRKKKSKIILNKILLKIILWQLPDYKLWQNIKKEWTGSCHHKVINLGHRNPSLAGGQLFFSFLWPPVMDSFFFSFPSPMSQNIKKKSSLMVKENMKRKSMAKMAFLIIFHLIFSLRSHAFNIKCDHL